MTIYFPDPKIKYKKIVRPNGTSTRVVERVDAGDQWIDCFYDENSFLLEMGVKPLRL